MTVSVPADTVPDYQSLMLPVLRAGRKPERKAAAEEAMRATVGGDSATIVALDAGRMDEALKAAAWRRKLDEEAAALKRTRDEQAALDRRMAPQQVTLAQP